MVDADLLARQVVEPGQPALAELVARFGAAILTADGRLDRKRLGAIAFADPAARADLGRITHPRIAAASAAAIATWADAGANVVFYEAALLVENRAHTGLAGLIVVAVAARAPVRAAGRRATRCRADDARARIAAQAPLADKLAAATWVIENAGDLAALEARGRPRGRRHRGAVRARSGCPSRARRRPRPAGAAAARDQPRCVTGFPAFTAQRMIAQDPRRRARDPALRARARASSPTTRSA